MAGYNVMIFKEKRYKVDDGNGGTVWKDFREEDLHVPVITPSTVNSSIDTTTDNLLFDLTGWTPKKGRITEEIEIPVDYNNFLGFDYKTSVPKYMIVSYNGVEVTPFSFCAWIDSAEPVATKGPSTNTRVHFHIDWFMTMCQMERRAALHPDLCNSRGFGLGAGRVRRGGSGTKRPDPSAPRRWVHDKREDLVQVFENNNYTWVYVVFTENSQNKIIYYPIGEHVGPTPGGGLAPPLQYISDGQLLTLLGVSSTTTHAAWLCPFQPAFGGNAEQLPNSSYWVYKSLYTDASTDRAAALSETYECDDLNQVSITDMLGNITATLPWGSKFNYVSLRMEMGINVANAVLTFYYDDGTDVFARWRYWWQLEGYTVTIPCIALPIFANALSDYVFSGQRDYDITSAKLQREQALKNGIANIGGSVVGGAVAGSMTAPGVGTIVGAAAGATSGIVGTTVGYGLSVQYDYKNQEAVDKLMANQGATVVQSGGGFFWMHTNVPTSLVRLVRDDVSAAELTIEQEETGYITDYYITNCNPLVSAGGPLRVENLVVNGDVCPECKQYIAALFARGVHLDLIP